MPGGYRWDPTPVRVSAWQAHVLKHPLGLRAIRELGADWDYEGWANTTPPVVDAPQRERLFRIARDLSTAAQPCGVPEVFDAPAPRESEDPECYACGGPLVGRCFSQFLTEGVSRAYAAVTEDVVVSLGDGTFVDRRKLARTLQRGVKRPEVWRELVVMTAGRLTRSGIEGFRLTRGDGVRVELKIRSGEQLEWRTTYRLPLVADRAGGWGYLLDTLPPGSRTFLSDAYVVPRAWWETHGN